MIYENERYITNIGSSCLTACIINYFNYKKLLVSEEDLLLSSNALNLFYKKHSGFSIPLFTILRENLYNHNIILKQFDEGYESLDHLIRNENMIFAYIDKNIIKYAEVFNSFHSSLKFHCINIIGTDIKGYIVSDGFIPTRIPISFQGFLDIDDKNIFIKMSKIYSIEINKRPTWNKDEILFHIKNAIENYFTLTNDINPFGEMGQDILDFNHNDKEYFLEYSISIAVGGVLASRKLFLRMAYKIAKEEYRNRIMESESILLVSYKKLQLLLTKCYLALNEANIILVLQMIKRIREIEEKLFSELKFYII